MERTTPKKITTLKENQIFVFGSNKEGLHGAGAAKLAYEKFGAIWGQGQGFQGQSYAIDTMSGFETIEKEVEMFIRYARQFKNIPITFLVTEIGCGIAGYSVEEIAPLFKDCVNIENIHLPKRFWEILT
jgi:hypothetical protein